MWEGGQVLLFLGHIPVRPLCQRPDLHWGLSFHPKIWFIFLLESSNI